MNVSKKYFIFLHIMLILLVIIILSFIYKELSKESLNPQVFGAKVNINIPAIPVRNEAGKEINLFGSTYKKPLLLFVLSTTCSYCEKNLQFWEELFQVYKVGFDIFGVSSAKYEQIMDYKRNHNIPYLIYSEIDNIFFQKLGIKSIPQTVIINRNSISKFAWFGEFNEKSYNEFKTVLDKNIE